MPKAFIGSAVVWRVWIRSRRNVRPCHMQQITVLFSDMPWEWWW